MNVTTTIRRLSVLDSSYLRDSKVIFSNTYTNHKIIYLDGHIKNKLYHTYYSLFLSRDPSSTGQSPLP